MRYALLKAVALTALLAATSHAWWENGHGILTRAAVAVLPDEIPEFFRAAGAQVSHMSMDPDVSKNKRAPAARESEYPEHYIDIELLKGRDVPASRFALVKLCCELGLAPEKVGFLPYAAAEWTDRLAVAFAEHRAWPKNEMIRQKCFVYAGFLSHYAQDLCQPLHTTIHFDGRAGQDGASPHSGIHAKVDGLIENLSAKPEIIARELTPVSIDSLMPFLLRELAATHALVDTVYALEQQFPAVKGTKPSASVAAFGMERMQRAAAVTAGLYLYAWQLSAAIELEDWIQR